LGKNFPELYQKIEGKPPPPPQKKEKTPTLGTSEDSSKFVLNTQATHNQVNSATPDEHSSEERGVPK